jgi:hypothetical protein
VPLDAGIGADDRGLAVVFQDGDRLCAQRKHDTVGLPANSTLLPPPSTNTGPSRSIP